MKNYEFPPQGEEAKSKLLEIIGQARELERAEHLSVEEIFAKSKELVAELIDHLKSDFSLELSADVTRLYNEMAREDLLARVEATDKVVECLVDDKPITLGASGKHTANSVIANQEGLRIAMAEAGTTGPIRFLIGLDVQTLIGFKGDHLEVYDAKEEESDVRDNKARSAYLRHVSGEIHREDIKYMVMRIPRKFFPEAELSPEEQGAKGQFIFRGTKLDLNRAHDEVIAQAA